MKYKFHKGMSIGALAAENDELLETSFVDLGHFDALVDTSKPRFLILGRAGSGKTALLQTIRKRCENVSTIDPDALSMQYLHNSPILRVISGWGVSLDVFYKYLWRHVCILELIRMRYGDVGDVPSKLQQLFDFTQLWNKEERKAKEKSQEYLQKYGNDYWIKTDTRIKCITTEIESKLKDDPKISARLDVPGGGVSASIGQSVQDKMSTKVEQEVIERAQSIVSDFQIAALNRVVELLENNGFGGDQPRFYLVIDDLDKNWMPDDLLYLDLVKSLLYTVHELNGKLRAVKIIVGLRENIYHRVFQKSAKHEPQREKWLDVQVRLTWSKEELTTVIDNRLREVLRTEYTQDAPTLSQILPDNKRKTEENALEYLLDRTFMRPRDVIDFLNTCIDQSDSFVRLSWSNITRAEREYSQRRLQSVFDEWKDSYFGLAVLFLVLRRLGPKFTLSDFSDEELFKIMQDPRCEQCDWLTALQHDILSDRMPNADCKVQLLKALYLVGIVGIREDDTGQVAYSFERAFNHFPKGLGNEMFIIHKMFWSALSLTERSTDVNRLGTESAQARGAGRI
jgi:hypothetical protein